MSKSNPKKLIEDQIRNAVLRAQDDGSDVSKEILKTLGRSKLIRYEDKQSANLLTSAGVVLAVILEDDSFTVRALAVYLGVTQPAIQKSLKILLDGGLIKRKKVSNRFIHSPDLKAIAAHRDISIFLKMKNPTNDEPF